MKASPFFLNAILDLDDPAAARDSVWRAMRPVKACEENGDGVLEVPLSLLIASDGAPSSEVQHLPLRIRAYGERVLRISSGGGLPDDHPIFAWDQTLAKVPLHWRCGEEVWELLDEGGRSRARINMCDAPVVHWSDLVPGPAAVLEAEWLPDGFTSVPLAARDAFTPLPRQTGSIGLGMVQRDGKVHRWTWSLAAAPGEHFAGTGERFARMDLAGGTYLLENIDALGVNSPRAYKNVPFYLSSRGYGLLVAGSGSTRLSLAGISTRAACGVIEEPVLDLFLIAGTPEQIVREYRRITGFPARPPVWSYGTWMARMTYFSAEEVETVGRRMREEQFPCDVLHLDTGWFKTDWKCEWEFSPERFPDPEGFFRRMRESGYRVSLWQLPVIARGTKHWEEATTKHYVAPPLDASEAAGSDFGGGSSDAATIDFTNPDAVAWYQGLLAELFRKGAAAIKTDFGENIDMKARYAGMTAARLHNLYALLYQKAAFDITREKTGDAIIWARAGWTGCQRYPVHWGGDAAATWDGLAGSLRGGLHAGVSGFGFWSHDVPGFHGVPNFMNSRPDDELVVRWTQFGVLSSHLRYHGTSAREPYEYPAVADIVRKWLRLRYALIPYLLEQAEITCRSGFPILRALLFHSPDDPTCWGIDDQFLCGESLLAAPLIAPGGIRDIYIPKGQWVDFWNGELLEGPFWRRNVRCPLHQMPIFGKLGDTLPIFPEEIQHTGQMDESKIRCLRIEPGDPLLRFGETTLEFRDIRRNPR